MAESAPGDYYRGIYLRGLAGERPSIPVDWAELERRAEQAMEDRAAGYVYAGAGSGATMRANREAFERRRIIPRMLRDVAERDLSTELLGTSMAAPVALAPIGAQTIVHDSGELASATVDTFIPGWKPRDLQQAWLPFLEGIGNANYLQDPVFRAGLEKTPEDDLGAAIGHYLGVYVNPSLTWGDLAWLRERTSLPILLKGILHPDDAREAEAHGVHGVIVSNHGGRQVDGSIASLDALGPIVEAIGGRITVLVDSGVLGRTRPSELDASVLAADPA